MKKTLTFLTLVLAAICSTACYEDFVKDYGSTATYFASQKPLRTVISGRDMTIEVGAVVGGKREGWDKDYCKFELDEALLDGTGLTMMPEEYYKLSDASKMKIYKSNIPLMKVTVEFTDAFYDDPESLTAKYALPFKIVETSLDSVLVDKNYTVVAVKYISNYAGTYYVRGQYSELDSEGEPIDTVSYQSVDLSKASTKAATTLSANKIRFAGIGSISGPLANQRIELEFTAEGIQLSCDDEGVTFSEVNASMKEEDELVITLSYLIDDNASTYKVEEVYTRRQDPYKDLVFEEW